MISSSVPDDDFGTSDTRLVFGPCDPCGEDTDTTGETTNKIVVYVKDDDNLEFIHEFLVSLESVTPDGVTPPTDISALINDDGKLLHTIG